MSKLDMPVCENVISNFLGRVTACRASREDYMHDIVFHA